MQPLFGHRDFDSLPHDRHPSRVLVAMLFVVLMLVVCAPLASI